MSRGLLWTIAIILVVGALAVFFVVLPGRQSKLAREGVLGYGTVEMKDSRPTNDGGWIYTATLQWTDGQNKNHRRDVQVYDKGVWDDLKAGQDIKVRYYPNNPDIGSIPGAEDMTTPRANAFKFVAWTALLVGIALGIKAWLTPRTAGPSGPVVARR